MKLCSKCHTNKEESFFYKHTGGKLMAHCKACHLDNGRRWRAANPEASNAISRRSLEKNRNAMYERSREWRKSNLEYDAFRARTYRAKKLQAIPSWCDLEKVKEIYLNKPEGYHVDHIIPLQGKTVCGLHVPENLQYLTPTENMRKRNIYHA